MNKTVCGLEMDLAKARGVDSDLGMSFSERPLTLAEVEFAWLTVFDSTL